MFFCSSLLSLFLSGCDYAIAEEGEGAPAVKQHPNEMSTLYIGADGTLISNNEISFKFPIDDHPICTIDEYIIPPTQPSIGKFIPSSG